MIHLRGGDVLEKVDGDPLRDVYASAPCGFYEQAHLKSAATKWHDTLVVAEDEVVVSGDGDGDGSGSGDVHSGHVEQWWRNHPEQTSRLKRDCQRWHMNLLQ